MQWISRAIVMGVVCHNIAVLCELCVDDEPSPIACIPMHHI